MDESLLDENLAVPEFDDLECEDLPFDEDTLLNDEQPISKGQKLTALLSKKSPDIDMSNSHSSEHQIENGYNDFRLNKENSEDASRRTITFDEPCRDEHVKSNQNSHIIKSNFATPSNSNSPLNVTRNTSKNLSSKSSNNKVQQVTRYESSDSWKNTRNYTVHRKRHQKHRSPNNEDNLQFRQKDDNRTFQTPNYSMNSQNNYDDGHHYRNAGSYRCQLSSSPQKPDSQIPNFHNPQLMMPFMPPHPMMMPFLMPLQQRNQPSENDPIKISMNPGRGICKVNMGGRELEVNVDGSPADDDVFRFCRITNISAEIKINQRPLLNICSPYELKKIKFYIDDSCDVEFGSSDYASAFQLRYNNYYLHRNIIRVIKTAVPPNWND